MFGLENLTDTQRKALLIGVPAVALVAVGTRIGKSGTPAPADETPTTAPPTGYIPAANTDAIGVGQLADFESKVTQSLQDLWNKLGNGAPSPTPTPKPTPTPQPGPAPAPAPSPAPSITLPGPTLIESPGGISQWHGSGVIWVGISQATADVFLSYGYPVIRVTDAQLQQLIARYGGANGYPHPGTGF